MDKEEVNCQSMNLGNPKETGEVPWSESIAIWMSQKRSTERKDWDIIEAFIGYGEWIGRVNYETFQRE